MSQSGFPGSPKPASSIDTLLIEAGVDLSVCKAELKQLTRAHPAGIPETPLRAWANKWSGSFGAPFFIALGHSWEKESHAL